MGTFVENVNKLATDLTVENVAAINTVADNINEVVSLANNLPIIDDITPSTVNVYSSSKTQALHDVQQQALNNVSSCSGSLVKSGANINVGTGFTSLAFTAGVATTNALLFVIGTDEIELKTNGTYNFTSTIEIQLNTNSTRVVTFEVYDKNTLAVISTTVASINGGNGDILHVPLNTLMVVDTVPYNGSIFVKVRVKADIGVSDIVLRDFSSTLVLSGAASGGGQLLGKAGIKAIGYMAQSTSEALIVPDGTNAFSIGSIVLEDGASITVPNGTYYKIL